MAKKSKPSYEKRQKEMARQQRMRDKTAARVETKERKAAAGSRSLDGEDPDLAGIRPGPQPLPDAWNDLPTDVQPATDDEEEEG